MSRPSPAPNEPVCPPRSGPGRHPGGPRSQPLFPPRLVLHVASAPVQARPGAPPGGSALHASSRSGPRH
eukprot:11216169-Lingulodinium_polyedra.AAC.1